MKWAGMRWTLAAGLALGLVTVAVTAFRPREPECIWTEPPTSAVSANDVIHQHVRGDLADARAQADAFSDLVARRPMLSDSIDAEAGAQTAPARARAWCLATLEAEIAAVHHLRVEDVRSDIQGDETGPAASQAVAERASSSSAPASVVSQPSR